MTNTDNLQLWIAQQLHSSVPELAWQPLSGDASFRRYFRCQVNGQSYIAALAPPATEKNHEFVQVADMLRVVSVTAPIVIAVDYEQGFILQNDLGDDVLLQHLNQNSVDFWYHKAMQQLRQMLPITQDQLAKLPAYNATLLNLELSYFKTWFLQAMLHYECSAAEEKMLTDFFSLLVESAENQPQVFVHRDYHSRNIMIVDKEQLATIDFQDAVCGPITYDLVSLLRDCYIVWPDMQVKAWVKSHWQQLIKTGQVRVDEDTFQQWFDLMGLQRHIKVLGIFARLSIRDNKHGYLNDLPTVVNYVRNVARQQVMAKPFLDWFDSRILPLAKQQAWGKSL